MGVGETLESILALCLAEEDDGMSQVVAAATLCKQWRRIINNLWEEVSVAPLMP